MKFSDVKDDECVVICSTIDMPHVKNVSLKECAFCGKKIWFADSTNKVVESENRKFYLACVRCASQIPSEFPEEDHVTMMPTDEQIQDVANTVGRPFEEIKIEITKKIKELNQASKFRRN